ncbi:MAG: hypothetical protein AAFS10_27035, partial [Myxococcota bacterium]
RILGEMLASGQMSLLRAQALEDAIQELMDNPMNHDDPMPDDVFKPHWVKICYAAGRIDTGLRVIYLLNEDGSVWVDDLLLKPIP